MFTGIVGEVGSVREVRHEGARSRLVVDAGALAGDVAIGDSVAVDGVCLTVTSIEAPALAFDVVTETLRKSTLGRRARGDRVNLEGALKVGDRLSGHFVMGHVDGVGELVARAEDPGQLTLTFRAPDGVRPFLLEKGSIAISGVSLTTWDVDGALFKVALVPHTRGATTLETLRRGDPVNLEADVLARWIAKRLHGSGLTMDRLREAGWDVGA